MTTDTNPLYTAVVGYMVSETSQKNSWEQIANFAIDFANHASVVDKTSYVDLLNKEFNVVEQQIKHDYKVNKLPGAWRSAKSTVLSAIQHDIPLRNEGAIIPKTEVSKAIAAAKKDKTRTQYERAMDQLADALSELCKLADPKDLESALNELKKWSEYMTAHRLLLLNSSSS
jgi:hypothetical protein